jgi:hypothetical protein
LVLIMVTQDTLISCCSLGFAQTNKINQSSIDMVPRQNIWFLNRNSSKTWQLASSG